MIRNFYLEKIKKQFEVHPICAILGARQVGKTTIARQFAAEEKNNKIEFFDLENPFDLASLENPMLTLSQYDNHLIIIDEIQFKPDLFPVLRVLVDHPQKKYRFLILGSASQELINKSSETLAGRIGYVFLPGFTLRDVNDTQRLLIRGGFPRSYLADTDQASLVWKEGYIITFLQKDLPSFGFDISTQIMHKFWMMLCFYHGQTFNANDMATSLMISDKTVRRYLDILASTFMIRILYPWFENIKKRQTKTPKIYFKDSGIFNALASITSMNDLVKNPKIGALWEGFALEQIINYFDIKDTECFFWSTHNDAELDLLIFKNGKKIGFEFKYSDNPKTTKSMRIAKQDLNLDHLYVIFPGNRCFPFDENITACGLDSIEKITI